MLNQVLSAADLALLEALLMVLIIFLAGIVRGFSGFGSSALVMTSMGLITPARELVPMMMALEILASLHLFTQVRRQINWTAIGWIVLIGLFTVPLGQWILLLVPVDPMRLLVSLLVLAAALLLWRQGEPWLAPTTRTWITTGLVAGLMNGLAAIGGIGAMLMFLATRIAALEARATLVGLLFTMGLYSSAVAVTNGLLDKTILIRVALMFPPLALGVAIGSRGFTRSPPASFRRLTLILLIVLALCGIARSLF